MKDQIVHLAEKLLAIKSDPDKKEELYKILDAALEPLQNEGFAIEMFERNGYKSALIHNQKERPERFKILLNGHLDVIPGKDFQYKPKIKDGKLYGVGAMDMKSNTATLIYVFKEMASQVDYPLGLQLVTEEEIGGFDGTMYQVEQGVKADFVISGEATNLDIENRMKGIAWLKISTKGLTAHGAYPWKGKNAIRQMNEFLNVLIEKYPDMEKEEWVTTVNISNIEASNKTFNKIPDHCEVWLDIRYVPEESDEIIGEIKRLMPDGFEMEQVVKEPSHWTKEDNEYIQNLKGCIELKTGKKVRILSANGSSDLRHFSRVGIDGVEFGPIGGGMGSDEEWVDIQSLEDFYEILKEFLIKLN